MAQRRDELYYLEAREDEHCVKHPFHMSICGSLNHPPKKIDFLVATILFHLGFSILCTVV